MRFLWLAIVLAATTGARADECDGLTEKVVTATGARFDHRSPSGEGVFLAHPIARDFTVRCPHAVVGPRSVSLAVNDPEPPARFYVVFAQAVAAAVGVEAARVEAAARRCHRMALRTPEDSPDVRMPDDLVVSCRAFRRDGGTTLLVAQRRPG